MALVYRGQRSRMAGGRERCAHFKRGGRRAGVVSCARWDQQAGLRKLVRLRVCRSGINRVQGRGASRADAGEREQRSAAGARNRCQRNGWCLVERFVCARARARRGLGLSLALADCASLASRTRFIDRLHFCMSRARVSYIAHGCGVAQESTRPPGVGATSRTADGL